MSELAYRKLDAAEIQQGLAVLAGWTEQDDALVKRFEFTAYQEGLVFATAVGYLADRLNHHPDMTIGYRTVSLSLTTHDTSGISPYDLELAHRIEAIAKA